MRIAEELLLLYYDDAKGTVDPLVDSIDYRLAGAVLVELALLDRVEVTESEERLPDGTRVKRGRVVVRGEGSCGDLEFDNALAEVAAKPRTPSALVPILAKGLRKRLLADLAEHGVLRRDKRKAAGLFPHTRWPAEDGAHEASLRARLQAVLLDGATPSPSEAALLALGDGAGLVKRLVPKPHRKEAKARAKEVASSTWASDATKKAIDELMAGVIAAVIVPASTIVSS
ncbi:MAG: GPP34 family phosphoprotein [Micrococcales bacterium]|nr:GPP34 family phosphoprotein [Micrococcales bacterium]